MSRDAGHSPRGVVLPTLVVVLLGLAVTSQVAAQSTASLTCTGGPVIASGSSAGSVAIPDKGSAQLSATVSSLSGTYVKALVVRVSVTHPNIGEVALSLTAPGGQTWTLKAGANNTGGPDGGAGGAMNTLFYNADCTEYAGLPSFSDARTGDAPFPGPYQLSGPSIFGAPSSSIGGSWTVTATDGKTGDVGTLDGFSISIIGQAACPTNAPVDPTISSFAPPCGTQAWYSVGTACTAVCAGNGFGGSARCLNNGWVVTPCTNAPDCSVNIRQGDPIVNEAPAFQAYTNGLIKAPSTRGSITIQIVNLNGGKGPQCTNTVGATVAAPVPLETQVQVQCFLSTPLGQGAYPLQVRVTSTGANGCASSSKLALLQILVQGTGGGGGTNTTTAPQVTLTPPSPITVCKQAALTTYTITAVFPFTVIPASGPNTFQFDESGSANINSLTCTAVRRSPGGSLLTGTVTVTCTGPIPINTQSVVISATLAVSQGTSQKTTQTAAVTASFTCCNQGDTTAYSVNGCNTCGNPISGVFTQGVGGATMVAGPLGAGCTGAGNVGSVNAACAGNGIKFTVQNQAGTASTPQYAISCRNPNGGTCPAFSTPNRRNQLSVNPSGQTTFSVPISPNAGCNCNTAFWAIRQTGKFAGLCQLQTPSQGGARIGPRRNPRG